MKNMKGLLLKDLILIREQAKTLLVIAVGGVCMSLAFEPTTVISYLTIIAAMVMIGTISYDEFDNGFSYLFTLPVTRKMYVREKYVFSVVGTIFFVLASTLLSIFLAVFLKQSDLSGYLDTALLTLASVLAVVLLYLALMIPLRIKYGSEQGKIVQFLFFAFLALMIFAVMKFGAASGVDIGAWIKKTVSGWSIPVLLVIIFLAIGIIMFLSERISERVISAKEY